MKKCSSCGYEGEEVLICPKCGGNMEYPDKPKGKYTAVSEFEPESSDTFNDHASGPAPKKGFLATPMTRKSYWIYVIASNVAAAILAYVFGLFAGDGGQSIVYIAAFVFLIVLQIKRLRDANRSLAWLLLDLLSIVGIIVIGCFPSNHVNNKWAD